VPAVAVTGDAAQRGRAVAPIQIGGCGFCTGWGEQTSEANR
jgi:hypothetical protein